MSEDRLPRPMVNMKPARKKDTAAQRFTADHQEKYEAHGRNPDQIVWVERHNNTYPKMRSELEKRKDTVNPRVLKNSISRQSRCRSRHAAAGAAAAALKSRASSKSVYCSHCRRLMRAELINDLAPKRPGRGRRSILKRSYTRNRLQRTRRIQNKYHSTRPKHGLKTQTMNMDPTTNASDVSIKSGSDSMEDEDKEYEVDEVYSKRKINPRAVPVTIRNSSSTVDSKYRNYNYDHNESRGTSYHSYHSMNHEPML